MNQTTRAWIYRVLTAINPLLIFYGVLEEEVVPLWMGLAGALSLKLGEAIRVLSGTLLWTPRVEQTPVLAFQLLDSSP